MNVRVSNCAAALLLAALPFAGQAAEPRYTYAEAGYFDFDFDDVDVDGDGFSIGGSLALTELLHVTASYADGETDRFDLDYSQLELALGLNVKLQPGLDVVGRVGYVDVEVDTPFGDADEDGYSLEGLLRWMATEQLELDAGVKYVDLDGSDTAFVAGALFSITENLALGAGLSVSDDITRWTLGGRYYFDLGR